VLSQSVYVNYSSKNFVRFWVSLRIFMERQVVLMSKEAVANMTDTFCRALSDTPYLAVPIGLLLPFMQTATKHKMLVKVAICMPLLSELARRAIYKTYLV
jgi:hypothetical protein